MSMAGKPELLAPAGDFDRLEMAVAYGADAVYLAGERFGLRAAAGNFSPNALKKAVAYCHGRGVKVYVTCNAVMRNEDIDALPAYFEMVQDAGADAVILSDLGAFSMAKKYAPGLACHISTQAGVASFETARMLHELGASRVILARELTLTEISEIRAKTPRELEIEVFVHGAMCVSFSGRCLLSNFLAGRDANRGACAQPCRWRYFLTEAKRPGEYYEITEDHNGTYILNARDLCMLGHIPEVLAAGATSLKIEGRMKSTYYAAVITNAYRHAIDAALEGRPLDPVWLREADKVSHRPYSTGFFFGRDEGGQYTLDALYVSDADVVAIVDDCDADGRAKLTQRNKFNRGDTLELLRPGSPPVSFTAEDLTDEAGEPIEATPHPMMRFRLTLPQQAPRLSILRKPRSGGEIR
jgi:putative protease